LEIRSLVRDYREAVDSVVQEPGGHLLNRYYQFANPLLRAAVAGVAKQRDLRFEEARTATAKARDDATRARSIVLLIAALAVAISIVVALRLARHVLLPLRELASAAAAIRDGQFETRVRVESTDEIGDVSEVFNEMSRRLGEFHQSNLGEVLRAKRALEATLRALPDAVLLVDGQGNVAATNPQAKQLLAQLRICAPLTAQRIADGFGQQAHAFCEALVSQRAFDRVSLEAAFRLESGTGVRRVLPRVVPLASDDGHGGGVVVVLSDVTQLARLDEMRSELVALASHELRTPVTTLRMSLLMLREMAERLDQRAQALLKNALGGVDLLAETVDEVLDMTRIEAGALMLNTEPIDLVKLTREAVERNRERADELGIRLSIYTQTQPAVVVGDAARLRIVLDNLLSNALKYTPRTGEIRVRVWARLEGRGGVEVSVADTGSGIPREFESRVFEKFFRVEHHRSNCEEAPRGSGIGLYLCKEIVELHGGHIYCKATESGRGTCVAFEVPLSKHLASASHIDVNTHSGLSNLS
jgi:NtrC-family two-component system sensor histidine kinase KinB